MKVLHFIKFSVPTKSVAVLDSMRSGVVYFTSQWKMIRVELNNLQQVDVLPLPCPSCSYAYFDPFTQKAGFCSGTSFVGVDFQSWTRLQDCSPQALSLLNAFGF